MKVGSGESAVLDVCLVVVDDIVTGSVVEVVRLGISGCKVKITIKGIVIKEAF